MIEPHQVRQTNENGRQHANQATGPDGSDKARPWLSLAGKTGLTLIMYPFDYARTLMQLGYEPLAPKLSRTIFWRPVLRVPGIFTYIGYMRHQDGFVGLYRGFGARLTGLIIHDSCFEFFMGKLPPLPSFDEDQIMATEQEKILNFVRRTSKKSLASALAILASQPFRVIAVRTMAQFIGREDTYSSLLGSLVEVFSSEGFSGVWSGLLPKMCGDLLQIWIVETIVFLINAYVIEDPTAQTYIASIANFLASSMTYPFAVVSTVMSVSGAPISAGGPPYVALYSGWTQCYAHLRTHGQLKRGSSLFWRNYHPLPVGHGIVYKQGLSSID